MGNFSGQSGDAGSLSDRKFLRVDIDNFEDVLEKLAPTARVSVGDRSDTVMEVEIRERDDFHPDSLYHKVPIFHELRELRKRLMNTSSFSAAASELNEALSIMPPAVDADSDSSAADAAPADPNESNADTLERVLGQSAKSVDTSPGRSQQVDIQSLIHQIVAPYIEPKPDPRQDEYVQHADSAIAGQMRSLLHNSSFQTLEAAWLALDFLVSQVAHSDDVQVFIWDVTKSELLQASESENDQLEDSLLFRRLVTDREQVPFSLFVTNESFTNEINDLILLTRLGAIGANSGGPVLAGAAPQFLGCKAWTDEINVNSLGEGTMQDENWGSIRTSDVAPWIGLTGPRFLLRLPYGTATSPVDAFDFEEIADPNSDHESLLWGTPSFLVARLIASSFLESGWSMNPGDQLEIGDLPALTYKEDGEVLLKACAEAFIPERIADEILGQGVMPLMSYKNRNAARVMRVQSISSPAAALAGPWS